jgi:hypothetical protein
MSGLPNFYGEYVNLISALAALPEA